MIPEQWQQVKDVLHEALQVPAEQRTPFLDSACNGDQAIRKEVDSLLLEENADTDGFLRLPLDFNLENAPRRFRLPPGQRIGAYEILEEIAVGGMGAVYRAVRADGQYKQQVALKIVRMELGAEFTTGQFRNERQILARLNHPNIAKILDGGSTEDGVLYLVMELVEGRRLDHYCDVHKLGTTERLNLFLQICAAVQYAHQRLIIHRDIKPGNILVNAEGVPKLLDFGIAKILESTEGGNQPEQTISLVRQLTPEYASPEQIKGEPITTASDVYSLGVVLYELLTGSAPYNVPTNTPHELSRAVCETEPERPSMAVLRKHPPGGEDERKPADDPSLIAKLEGSPEKLSKRLSGDLDNIVLMALRKEPQRRYASVEQFTQDIRRHLEHLPVIARKDTFGYRTSKFITRHKAGVIVAAFVTVALLSATGITIRQARIARAERARAERRFNDVRSLANSLIFEVHDAIQDLPGSTPARKLIVEKGLQYLDSLAQQSNNDPSLQQELAAAYDRIGDVQGLPLWANLGDTTGAMQSYQKALAIRQQLAKSGPRDLAAQRDLATGYEKMDSILESMGQDREALNAGYQALAIREKLVAMEPRSPVGQHDLAGCHNIIASALWDLGDLKGVLQHYKAALDGYESLSTAHPENSEYRRMAAVIAFKIASVYMNLGNSQKTVEFGRQAVTALEALASADAINMTLQRNVAGAKTALGFGLLGEGDTREARAQLLQAAAIDERLSVRDPENVRLIVDLSFIYTHLGDTEVSAHRRGSALRYYHRALQKADQEARKDPLNAETQSIIANCYRKFGELYEGEALAQVRENERRVHCHEAQAWFQKALQRLQALNDKSAPPGYSHEINQVQMDIAKCESPSHSGSGTRSEAP